MPTRSRVCHSRPDAMTESPTRSGGSLREAPVGFAGTADDESAATVRELARRRLRSAASTVGFVVVLIAGLVVRLLALRTSLGLQNSDESIIYLMARRVEHGDFRVFYWGQQYGGTILQLTAGALFWLVGASFVKLQVVEIAFWFVAC